MLFLMTEVSFYDPADRYHGYELVVCVSQGTRWTQLKGGEICRGSWLLRDSQSLTVGKAWRNSSTSGPTALVE